MRRHLHGAWQPWRTLADDAILARLLKEELELHPEIEARCAELQKSWPDRPKIGVHVRHTDRLTNLRRLRRRVDEMRMLHPEALLFLATDSRAVLDDFLIRYEDVLTAPKWLPESGPLHALHGVCPDRLAMARSALVDMRLLASCDQLIVNEDSTFSLITRLWWQALRGADRACLRRDVRSVATLGWLPFSIRDRAWRTRDCDPLRPLALACSPAASWPPAPVHRLRVRRRLMPQRGSLTSLATNCLLFKQIQQNRRPGGAP